MRMDFDPKKSFGRRVADIRRGKRLSQEAVALESGIGRAYLSEVERGNSNITLLNICKLAKALGVRLCELMDFD